MDPSDAFDELAAGAFRGDESRARMLFECCHALILAKVHRTVRGVLVVAFGRRTAQEAGDVAQAALMEVWKSRARYRGRHPGELWNFIKTIAYRTAIKYIDDQPPPPPRDYPESGPRPPGGDQPLMNIETRRALEECRGRLRAEEPQLYEAVVLIDLLAMPEQEAADVLGVAKSTLGDWKRRGRDFLRQCLKQRGIE